ncbi:hypothetical protein JYK22_08775, partial [Nonomuraea sp. RK-328]|nr:hypothetical protein [Nonomuraea sp. RK-328]
VFRSRVRRRSPPKCEATPRARPPDETEALICQAAEHADDEPAWMYLYDQTWFRLQRGMIELHLSTSS